MDARIFQQLKANQLSDKDAENKINQLFRWASGLESSISADFVAHIASSHHDAKPTFSAHKGGAGQSISSATNVKITFSTELWDVGGYFDSGTWTPPSGKYRLSAAAALTGNAVDNELLVAEIFKNGALHRLNYCHRGTTQVGTAAITCSVEANGTDTFEFYVQKSGAGDGVVSGSTLETWFEGEAI